MDLKTAVTPSGFDNIGAVMKQLGYPFKQIQESVLHHAGQLEAFDVVFINCSSSCQTNAAQAGKAILKYVSDGGTIYASDYAADYVAAAFPGAIQFAGKRGSKGDITARIVDKGLKALMGNTIQLRFDMGSWEQIHSVGKDTTVYLESGGRPILASFAYGKGQVIYTCFHNHAQVSKQEAELLRYLVIKPLMAQASAELDEFAWGNKKDVQETVGTASQGQASLWYAYDSTAVGPLMIMLNWKGDAQLGLDLQTAGGEWQQAGSSPPVSITVPVAQPGTWRYRVRAVQAPYSNFPFVILIGPAGQVSQSYTETPPASVWAEMMNASAQVDDELLDSINILGASDADEPGFEIQILDE